MKLSRRPSAASQRTGQKSRERSGEPRGLHRPTRWIAAGLLVVAGLGIWAWFALKGFRAWTPNIVVGAITAAVTITIIDWAVRHEAKQRLQPEIDDVLAAMGLDLRDLLASIVLDYAQLETDPAAHVPSDALELMDRWISTLRGGRRDDEESRMAILTHSGSEFADKLENHRRRDRDAIPLALRRAIDNYQERAQLTAHTIERDEADTPTLIKRESVRQLVDSTRAWYGEFLNAGGQPVVVADVFRDIAQKIIAEQQTEREQG